MLRLIDNTLTDARERRKATVERMAQDLIRFDAFRNEGDAVRSLYGTRRYDMADIVMLIDDARQVAMQEIVARAVSES